MALVPLIIRWGGAAALVSGWSAGAFSTARPSRLLATAVILVDGRPRAELRFLLTHAAFFVAFGDMVGFAFLLLVYLDFAPRGMADSFRHYVPNLLGTFAVPPRLLGLATWLLPAFLLKVREKAAAFAQITPSDLQQVLVTEY
jgi:hypothetical protein